MMQVKEHRAFTLETMANHSSPTELLQEIRQMVTQLKSYLLQSTELQAMLEPQHQYTLDKMGKIRVESLAVFLIYYPNFIHWTFKLDGDWCRLID